MSETFHVPGAEWMFAVGPSLIVALDPAMPIDVVEAVWALARRSDVAVEEVVAALPLGSEVPYSFAIVTGPLAAAAGDDEITVSVVVRGRATVDVHSVGGSRRFDAQGAEPWLLADFGSVVGVTLHSTAAAALGRAVRHAVALPLDRGVSLGSELVWSATSLERDGAAPGRTGAEAGAEATGTKPNGSVTSEALPNDDTIMSRRGPRALRPRTPLPDDETILSRRVVASTVESAQSTESPPPPQLTDSARSPQSTPPAPAEPPITFEPAESHSFTLRFPDGSTYVADTIMIIGRNPRRPRTMPSSTIRLVTVPSPTKRVSSTHVRIEPTGAALAITDTRSSNGTIVTAEGVAALKLRPGESIAVASRARVDLGDGIIIEIVPPERR